MSGAASEPGLRNFMKAAVLLCYVFQHEQNVEYFFSRLLKLWINSAPSGITRKGDCLSRSSLKSGF